MKVYVIQSKNGVIMNVGVSVKNKMSKGFVKSVIWFKFRGYTLHKIHENTVQ